MRKIMFATIMGITALAVLVIITGSVSAQQTGTTLPAGQDINLQSLASNTAPLAGFLLVNAKGGGWHGRARSGFGFHLGYGGPGYLYYGGYPYGYGYGGYSVSPGEPTCVWNGYENRCYDSSGQLLE